MQQSNFESYITITKKIESLIKSIFNVDARGLHELTSKIENKINHDLTNKLRIIATCRNKLMHEEGFNTLDMPSNFFDLANEIVESFTPIRKVHIKSESKNVLDKKEEVTDEFYELQLRESKDRVEGRKVHKLQKLLQKPEYLKIKIPKLFRELKAHPYVKEIYFKPREYYRSVLVEDNVRFDKNKRYNVQLITGKCVENDNHIISKSTIKEIKQALTQTQNCTCQTCDAISQRFRLLKETMGGL